MSWAKVLHDLGVSRGNPGWAPAFMESMSERGEELGIHFRFDTQVGNSMDSLRLLHWCWVSYPDKQEALASALARLHFEQQQCVAKRETMLAGCAAVGIAHAEAACVIDDPLLFRADVEKLMSEAHAHGHCSIPVFTFRDTAGRVVAATHGSCSVVEFRAVLAQLAALCM
mmetsp:Transcript_16961/g.43321  ORF Transcript_16961/g.43321 Transcript_16961/m.43321 type:complete len:170 (-) Transcript_16961:202-711(-)